MTDSFTIVVLLILVIQVLMLSSFLRLCLVAKAGKVTDFHWKYKLLYGKIPSALDCNGKIVDTSYYKDLYVFGNSMKNYKICNGMQVFVSQFLSQKDKESISGFPVLVFHIYNKMCQSQYELRKLVCYVSDLNEANWDEIYNEFKTRIKIEKEEFIDELQYKKIKINNTHERYILSETYDEDDNKHHYSLHPVSALYGKVMYAF